VRVTSGRQSGSCRSQGAVVPLPAGANGPVDFAVNEAVGVGARRFLSLSGRFPVGVRGLRTEGRGRLPSEEPPEEGQDAHVFALRRATATVPSYFSWPLGSLDSSACWSS